jgi:hypothetical protein
MRRLARAAARIERSSDRRASGVVDEHQVVAGVGCSVAEQRRSYLRKTDLEAASIGSLNPAIDGFRDLHPGRAILDQKALEHLRVRVLLEDRPQDACIDHELASPSQTGARPVTMMQPIFSARRVPGSAAPSRVSGGETSKGRPGGVEHSHGRDECPLRVCRRRVLPGAQVELRHIDDVEE